MKTLMFSGVRLAWLTFKSGLWVPVAGIYAVQHLAAMPHIPASAALLMML
ncbi:hypothetical protein [Acidithiobacillus ferrivorans]|nr:hypothetical protein [Acidithiobacillus ferrivorans]